LKIKLIKDATINSETHPADSILDIEDQATIDALFADEACIEYTEEEAEAEIEQLKVEEKELVVEEAEKIKTEQKSILKLAVNKSPATGVNKMKGLIGKSVMERKAVGDVAGTTATEYMGYVAKGNKLWDAVSKISVNGNLRVVYANGVPTISTVTEGNTNAQTATPIAKTATLVKKFASFNVPTEYFEDVDGLDTYLSGGIATQIYKAVIGEMVAGAQTGATIAGLESIAASGDVQEQEFVSLTAPTVAELMAFKNLVHPDLRDGTTFIVSPSFWAGCESALLNEKNLGNQLITTGANPTMFGYPVIVCEQATTPIVGDLRQYVIGVGRELKVVQTDAPATDSVITSVSIRAAGAIGWKKDATYAAFAIGVVAQG